MGGLFVVQQVGVLGILMAVGYIITKKNIINDDVSKGITQILTNIALPALIISSFSFGYSKDTIKAVAMVFIYSLIIHGITIIMGKLVFRKYKGGKNAVLQFASVFPNSGFMGLPLIMELFGQGGVLYASIFLIPHHTLMWTYGEGLYTKGEKESPLKKLATSPSLIAVVIGIIIFILKIDLPYMVDKPLSMFASLTSPLSMLILGERITKLNLREIIGDRDIYYGCFIKLILSPLITFLVLKMMNVDQLLMGIIVTMQALPVAIMSVILSQKHDGETDFASKLAVVSHIISIITVPLIIIGTGILK